MATKTVITCDVCYTQKKETNHWIKAWIDEVEFVSKRVKEGETYNIDADDACGESCAIQLYSRWLQIGGIEATQPQAIPIPPNTATELDDEIPF